MGDSIESSGYPLGFRVATGGGRPGLLGNGSGQATFVTEARMLAGHQKEAVVHEGQGGMVWRVTSDEGRHLKGSDLAPFPLGFFNAGLHGDLFGRMAAMAKARGMSLTGTRLFLQNFYWLTGSFARGTGEGFSNPAEISLSPGPGVDPEALRALAAEAATASPAFAALRQSLTNTFALYINKRRETIETVTPSAAADAPDPYVSYTSPPAPDGAFPVDPIRKTDQIEEGEVKLAPSGTNTRILRTVSGASEILDPAGLIDTDTWLEMPGVSHFALRSDERAEGAVAPSGLALLSAGVAFCYMTQLSRYIENMKFEIDGVRLVQYSPYTIRSDSQGVAGPVDTHLFLNGRADPETHEQLLRIAARTCYLHATLATALPPKIRLAGDAPEESAAD